MGFIQRDSEKLPAQSKSAWFGFIKSIATFRGDLSTLPAPPFLLSPTSLLEYSTFWAEHPALFISPSLAADPKERTLRVLTWFLTTLKRQHAARDEGGKRRGLKPLNPVLGEVFEGVWSEDAKAGGVGIGETRLVAEQVEHHPPVTAFNAWNDTHGVRLEGHVAPRIYFSRTVHIERAGYSVLHLDKYDEDYLITMPKVHVEGLLTGQLAPELSGPALIRGSNGYRVDIEFMGKGWIGGRRNAFVARVVRDAEGDGEVVYTVEGTWSGEWVVREGKNGDVLETFDTATLQRTELRVRPIDEQHELESRRAWQPVVDAIHRGDICRVGNEKSKIENAQRERRKRERAEGTVWERRFFARRERDAVVERLGEGAVESGFGEEGGWSWDWGKYRGDKHREGEGEKSEFRARGDSGVAGMGLDLDEGAKEL